MNRVTATIRTRHALLIALLLLLAACSSGNEPEPTPTPTTAPVGVVAAVGTMAAPTPVPTDTPPPITGRITLWHGWAGAEGDALIAVLTAYADQTPGLQIATLFVAPNDLPAAYAEAVRNGRASGAQVSNGPDLVLMPNWWLADLVAADAALPLDPLLPPDALSAFWPGALDSMRTRGLLYGLPATVNTPALYVNMPLLDGVPPAGDTAAWLAAAGQDPAQGIGLYANFYHVAWGLPAFGATLLDDNGRVLLDQNQGATEFLTWLVALQATPGSYVSSDYGMLLDRFKKGEFAYFVDGPWALADLRTTLGDGLAVATLPAGPAGPARPWLYSDGFLINPAVSPEQQGLALNAALYFSGPAAGSLYAATGSLLPAARDAVIADPLLQGFARQAAVADAMPVLPEMEEVWTYGGDMLVKALSGSASLDVIVAETTALINDANGK